MSRLNVLEVLLEYVDLLADGIGKGEAQEEQRLLSQLNCLSLEGVRRQYKQWVVSASCSEAGRHVREIQPLGMRAVRRS